MRTRQLLLALVAVPAGLAGSQQTVEVHRSATPTVSVRISGDLAAIRVIGWDRDSVAITGTIGAGSRLDGGPNVTRGPASGLKYFVDAPDGATTTGNRLEVRVPARARVWVKAGSAEIEASGVTGGLDLNIVGGSVRVRGAPRELMVEAMDGNVIVEGTPVYARLKTATGDVELRAGAEDVSVATVSGAVRVASGAVQRGRFESVTGSVIYAADVPRGSDLRFDTHSGAVELRLLRASDVEIEATTITGVIENAWNSGRPIRGREGRGMELGTSNGSGSARISVRSFNGGVKLIAR